MSNCQHPNRSPKQAYDLGCRCDSCRSHKKQSNRQRTVKSTNKIEQLLGVSEDILSKITPFKYTKPKTNPIGYPPHTAACRASAEAHFAELLGHPLGQTDPHGSDPSSEGGAL